ncbi:MAG: alpha/beta hydrolase [Solirubrobacterales bacterium]|nr:alpha/beta hydrolase [Solirubrobacterales bacterium]
MPGTSLRRLGGGPTAWRIAAALAVLGLVLVGGSAGRAASPTHGARPRPAGLRGAPKTLRLGSLVLHRCGTSPLRYCGGLAVPLDYAAGAASPMIHIGFRWLPATATRRGKGTVLAVEGGPGFATTGTQGAYVAMMGSLRRTRNLLLVNLRGTGNSTLIDCPGLEHYGHTQRQYGRAFDHLVAGCGNRLNHTWRYRHGGWVRASDLFNTAYSGRDVARVVRALHLGRLDLYGDSYGSWFAQAFASRYAGVLRSVTLDSTYQVLRLHPWYTTTVVTARRAFARACSESVACASAANGSRAWARIATLAARLARAPVSGTTTSGAGRPTRLTVSAETLVNLVNNAGFDPVVYRDLDAAGRALVRHHDAAPLLRLAALSLGFDDTNYPLPEFSDGLYFAVACTDYVQLFSRSAKPAIRARQYRAALRRERPGVFAPFTIQQWTRMDQYTEAYNACLRWPTPTRLVAPITRRLPLVPRRLPVLILSGTLDSLTPWLHGATLVARQMGPSARVIRVANLTHVTLQDSNDSCPASIYQRFVVDPGALARMDASCARRVTPIHTVGSYPLRLTGAVPATPSPGNRAGTQALEAASVALAAVGDETSRWPLLHGRHDLGLRGGTVTFSPGRPLEMSFHDVRPVTDATVDGTARWNRVTDSVSASLTVRIPGAPAVRLSAHWRPFGAQSQLAVISGSQGKRSLSATAPPP